MRISDWSSDVCSSDLPVDKLMLQYVGGKQARRIGDGFQAIDSQRVIIGDKSDGEQPLAFHPPRQQHAQRLVRVPSLEAVGDHVMSALMREGFDLKLPRAGQAGAASLPFQPFAPLGGKERPLSAVTQKPRSEERREG